MYVKYDIFGKLWLMTYLNVTDVSKSVKASCSLFCGSVGETANVAKDRPLIRNCKENNVCCQLRFLSSGF
jgi:hypothetical protein